MSRTSLSIFDFGSERRLTIPPARHLRLEGESQSLETAAAVAVADDPEARAMVLDLEHLTPETLEAFFPSEHAIAR